MPRRHEIAFRCFRITAEVVQAASVEITFCLLLYFHESITHFFIMNGMRKALYIHSPYKANGIHEIKLIYINDFSRDEGKDDSEVEFCFLCFFTTLQFSLLEVIFCLQASIYFSSKKEKTRKVRRLSAVMFSYFILFMVLLGPRLARCEGSSFEK